ncbi:MAG TPA: hypothetical protein DEH78_31860, partial [Solibacterales bacterium]|nr:hypothetical protein [Bryobacterales bacterium]
MAAVIGLLLIAPLGMAQLRITGVISGTVQDPTGAAVPGAKVSLKDQGTGIVKETKSGESGTFVFPDLANGSYEMTVTAQGFSTVVLKGISVQTSQTTDVPVKLELGQQAQTVTVEGTAPVLETVAQLVTTTQSRETITQLPVLNRSNVLALARLAPGASPPGGGSTRYNNLPGGAVNVTVDGINNASNGFKSGGTVFFATVPVRLGAVEEVSVETGGMGADSGAQSGANIKFVTRRGGAQYHGSLFYEPRSEQFNANTWVRNANAATGKRVYFRQHDYGGNIGGRVVPFGYLKDKLFFFANYERIYGPRTADRRVTVLTPAAQRGEYTYLVNGTTDQTRTVNVLNLARTGGFRNTIDPVSQAIMNINNEIPKYAVQVPDNNFNTDEYAWSAENNLWQQFPATRFDYHATASQQITFSWNYYHSWQAGERRLPVPDVNRTNPFRLGYFVWSAALQSTLKPTVFNEFRYGIQHSGDTNAFAPNGLHYTFNNRPLRIGQTLPFGGTGTPLRGPVVPYIDQQNVTGRHWIATMYDTMTWIRNKHTYTMGFSFRSTDWKDTGEVFPIPTYTLGTPTGDPVPGLLFTAANMPGAINTEFGNSTAAALYNSLIGRVAQANFTRVVNPDTYQYDGFHNWTWTRSLMGGAFVQDRWRIKPSLTLNYGVRWEVQGPMYDVKAITAVPDQASVFGPSSGLFSPGTLSGNNNPTAEVGRQAFNTDFNNFAPNVGFAWNPHFDKGPLAR